MNTNVMRHQYYPMSEANRHLMTRVKDAALTLYTILDDVGSSRELSAAKMHLEETVMWATKHITRWKPLPDIPIPSQLPQPLHSPTPITLALLRLKQKELQKINDTMKMKRTLVCLHTDLEVDARDLPGFTPVYHYQDSDQWPNYEEEFGRLERFVFLAHPDLPRFSSDLYPVVMLFESEEGEPAVQSLTTYCQSKELEDL